jgi:hypothetical protein
MSRLPTIAGLACMIALGHAWAQESSPNSTKPHTAKVKTVKHPVAEAASLGDISFSDPYAPPVGSRRAKSLEFPAPERTSPVYPQGGFSISAGRDSSNGPMTGGLKFRF